MGIKKAKTLCKVIALAGVIGLFSCGNKQTQYIEGIVQKEAGTIVDRQKFIESSKGALFGNESIKFGDPTYVIQFKTYDGKSYTFAVKESSQKKLEALNLAIEEGTRIRMTKQDFDYYLKGTVGQVNDFELEVLE